MDDGIARPIMLFGLTQQQAWAVIIYVMGIIAVSSIYVVLNCRGRCTFADSWNDALGGLLLGFFWPVLLPVGSIVLILAGIAIVPALIGRKIANKL